MKTGFSEILTRLRHETGRSQRHVAAELGVSQALLSHYENGAREPRLEFVVRACDYYDVSADLLLGRAVRSDGRESCPESARKFAELMRGIFDFLEDKADLELYDTAAKYLVIPAENAAGLLADPDAPYDPMRDAEMKLAEALFVANVRRVHGGK